jgi:hypothetical protein
MLKLADTVLILINPSPSNVNVEVKFLSSYLFVKTPILEITCKTTTVSNTEVRSGDYSDSV